jgi:hypothetical protein
MARGANDPDRYIYAYDPISPACCGTRDPASTGREIEDPLPPIGPGNVEYLLRHRFQGRIHYRRVNFRVAAVSVSHTPRNQRRSWTE